MNKTRWKQWTNVLPVAIFCISFLFASQVCAETAAKKSAEAGVLQVTGKVKAVSNKAKTMSLSVKEKGPMLFKFNGDTKFVNADSAKAFKQGEGAVVKYRNVGPDMVAVEIKKAIAPVPEGVEVIDTSAVASLIQAGPEKGNYWLIDARPARRYNEGHLPTAISVPFMQLKKKGKSLLPAKGRTVIFYCGGPT